MEQERSTRGSLGREVAVLGAAHHDQLQTRIRVRTRPRWHRATCLLCAERSHLAGDRSRVHADVDRPSASATLSASAGAIANDRLAAGSIGGSPACPTTPPVDNVGRLIDGASRIGENAA